ncbi:MAG: hypothetical protein FWH22_11405, partial [Fibromonadales bacterium]|nr:hypothetical protein [Fibromonadales bacterium]
MNFKHLFAILFTLAAFLPTLGWGQYFTWVIPDNDPSRASIGNEVLGVHDWGKEYKLFNEEEGYAYLEGINLHQLNWENYAGAFLGLEINQDESSFDLSQCAYLTYTFKGAAHRFDLKTSEGPVFIGISGEPDGKIPASEDWRKVGIFSFERDEYDEAGQPDYVLNFGNVEAAGWTVRAFGFEGDNNWDLTNGSLQ